MNNIRSFIKHVIAESAPLNLVPHSTVVAAIDSALSADRLDIKIPYFRDLMIEISIVESGIANNGMIYHKNEKEGSIQGVFQLSPVALQQLRNKNTVPSEKDNFNRSSATIRDWDQQTDSEIFDSIKLQAVAACMYVLWLCRGKDPGFQTRNSRANFWKAKYNTASDKMTTAATYETAINTFSKFS